MYILHNFSSTTDQNEPKFIGGIFICEIKTVGYIIIINRLLIYKFHIISNIGKSLKFNIFMIRVFLNLLCKKARRLPSFDQITKMTEPLRGIIVSVVFYPQNFHISFNFINMIFLASAIDLFLQQFLKILIT